MSRKFNSTLNFSPAIGELVKCPLSLASRQKLALRAVLGGHGDSIQGNSLLGYLKSEVHVGTACVGVGVLCKWCQVMGDGEEVPPPLVDHIKVGNFFYVCVFGIM